MEELNGISLLHVIVFCALTAGLVATTGCGQNVGRYDVFQLDLTASGSYSNPYLDMSVETTFTHTATGARIKMNGFWDGGQSWKVRMAPTLTGQWTYTTSSADAGLNGVGGSFNCVSSSNKGFVGIHPNHPHSFAYTDGTPFFWLGDTCWGWYDTTGWIDFDGTFQNLVDTRKKQGFTVLQGTLYTKGQGKGQAFYSVSSETLNPEFFQGLDQRVQYITGRDMVLVCMLDWSECWKAGMSGKKYDRYASYVLSRYSAYNVMWGVLAEYEEINNDQAVRNAGKNIQGVNPYHHLITTHTVNTSTDSFGNDAWIDFHGQQQKALSIKEFNSWIISDRIHNRPVVNFEQGYEEQTGFGVTNPDEYRQAGWAILTGGGFFTYGHVGLLCAEKAPNWSKLHSPGAAEMGHIKAFWSQVEWWKMSPDNSLVTAGTGR
jgi:hypothetical protein